MINLLCLGNILFIKRVALKEINNTIVAIKKYIKDEFSGNEKFSFILISKKKAINTP